MRERLNKKMMNYTNRKKDKFKSKENNWKNYKSIFKDKDQNIKNSIDKNLEIYHLKFILAMTGLSVTKIFKICH